MFFRYRKGADLESGGLYPGMTEPPELRWALIRKIYVILTIQLALTAAVSAVVVTVHEVPQFFTSTRAGFALYIVLLILPFIVLCALYCCHQTHPWNLLLLGIFTITISFAIGLTCAYTEGKVVLEALGLTVAVVLSLTLYTFWAVKRGHDFGFLGPFVFSALLVLILFSLIQAFFPLGKLTSTIYGALAALIFSGYIIYDTNNIIKRYTYDEYILAAISLYLDIVNLFLALLSLLQGSE